MNMNISKKKQTGYVNTNIINRHIFLKSIRILRVALLYALINYALSLNYKYDQGKFYSFADMRFN